MLFIKLNNLMAAPSNFVTSRGINNDLLARSFQNRLTVPLGSSLSAPQREGSVIFDPRLDGLYISDGASWLAFITIDTNGNPSIPIRCVEDADKDTSICTDTDPNTDSDTIVFTTDGVERARISSGGVFMVGTTVPAAGKVAHFEGDIKVTGVVDPTATQYEEVSDHPVDPTGTTTGVVWVEMTVLRIY
ncbi:MAG: hypothetical protein JKX85_10380 [Phycisphaeraceae bacterium]|nr:hypothetical protein [Phycisphaeraceae bacterium]